MKRFTESFKAGDVVMSSAGPLKVDSNRNGMVVMTRVPDVVGEAVALLAAGVESGANKREVCRNLLLSIIVTLQDGDDAISENDVIDLLGEVVAAGADSFRYLAIPLSGVYKGRSFHPVSPERPLRCLFRSLKPSSIRPLADKSSPCAGTSGSLVPPLFSQPAWRMAPSWTGSTMPARIPRRRRRPSTSSSTNSRQKSPFTKIDHTIADHAVTGDTGEKPEEIEGTSANVTLSQAVDNPEE